MLGDGLPNTNCKCKLFTNRIQFSLLSDYCGPEVTRRVKQPTSGTEGGCRCLLRFILKLLEGKMSTNNRIHFFTCGRKLLPSAARGGGGTGGVTNKRYMQLVVVASVFDGITPRLQAFS